MSEAIMAMLFIAGIGAGVSLIVVAFSKSAKANARIALGIEASCVLGLGFLYLIGAGLQSPPDYPHWLIPIVFFMVLVLTHLLGRAMFLSEPKSNG